ncbi:MAG: GHKL domain-containing protein [Bacilli bacterium]|nr:GHKL domain-containing protein [Bacilli bacterium]
MNEQGLIPQIILGGQYQFFLELFIPLLCISFNCKKRSFFWLRALGIAVLSFPLYYLPDLPIGNVNTSYFITFAVIVACAFLLLKEGISVTLLSAASAFGIQHFAWNLMGIFFDCLPDTSRYTPESITWVYFVTVAFIYAMVALFFFKSKVHLVANKSKPIVYIIGAILLTITFLLSQLITTWNIYIRIYSCISSALALICIFLFPAMMDKAERLSALSNENVVLENLIAQQSRQNEISAEIREITNIHIHDLRHELEAIETYNDEDKKDYIDKVRRDLDLYEGFAKTGNETVDIILTEKSLLCHKKEIRFTYIVDGDALNVFAKPDLVSLLGNILDNAIEAASKEEGEYRIIKLNIKTQHSLLFIECSNYAHSVEHFDFTDYSSTKIPDGRPHGYGIKSMKFIAKRYGGAMAVDLVNHLFNVRITVPLSEPNKSGN